MAAWLIGKYIQNFFHPIAVRNVSFIHLPDIDSMVPCLKKDGVKPLMILAIGQSNAGNHGAAKMDENPPVIYYYDGHCYLTAGPIPGATGQGGNIWTYLSNLLSANLDRPVIFSVLAVDATSIDDWTDETELKARLGNTIRQGKTFGFVPEFILWQQGEADARNGMSSAVYKIKLENLNAYIHQELGENTTMIVARSTRCRNEGSEEIRNAVLESALKGQGIVLGPDTDKLIGELRIDGCHFSLAGLKAASSLWASVIISNVTLAAIQAR